MLLEITTTHHPATDLGYLLHKHPDKHQTVKLSFGQVHIFYPEATPERCTACILLDVDPIKLVRGTPQQRGMLDQYVNDRPFVASSFLSVALSKMFGTALAGRCQDRPELVETPIPLSIRLHVLPVRGEETLLNDLFEPLGYEVESEGYTLDDQFPEWGESFYRSVTLRTTKTLGEVLRHLYVLVPVFDNRKHYYTAESEVEKLLSKAEEWLKDHPRRDQIVRRYLRRQPSLARAALEYLDSLEGMPAEAEEGLDTKTPEPRPPRLHDQRHDVVVQRLRESGAVRVLDLGCGSGQLLRRLLDERQFTKIVGTDVSLRSLEVANRKLKLDRLPETQRGRIELLQSSLTYRDRRLSGFDAAAVVEVIEHLDPARLAAFERVLFEFAQPKTVVLTTPNAEYNVLFDTLPADRHRHADHRFEWTRTEFQTWAEAQAERFGYGVAFEPVGPVDETHGAPSQMAIFTRMENVPDSMDDREGRHEI